MEPSRQSSTQDGGARPIVSRDPEIASGSRPIGLIGLGPMGLAMTGRLIASGRDVIAYDPSAELRGSFPSSSPKASLAPSLFDLGDGASLIISTLGDAGDLKSALLGDVDRPGMLAAMRSGSIVVQPFSWAWYADTARRCKLYDFKLRRWIDFGGRPTSQARAA